MRWPARLPTAELLVQLARLRERPGVAVLRRWLAAVRHQRLVLRGEPQELADRDVRVDAEALDDEQLHRPMPTKPDVPGARCDVDAEAEAAEARPAVEHRQVEEGLRALNRRREVELAGLEGQAVLRDRHVDGLARHADVERDLLEPRHPARLPPHDLL